MDFLDDYKDESKPFFLYLAYTAPHDPLQAWPEDIKKYEDRYKDGWAALRKERYARQKQMGIVDDTMPLSKATFKDWESLSDENKKTECRKMAVYAAMIDRVDQNIGKLLGKLKALGKLDNTLIMFASDNGSSSEVVRLQNQTGEIGEITRWTSLGGNWANAGNTPYRMFKTTSLTSCQPCWKYPGPPIQRLTRAKRLRHTKAKVCLPHLRAKLLHAKNRSSGSGPKAKL